MRVAIIHPFLYRLARGIERFTFSLANELAAQGTDVTLLTWRWDASLAIDKLDARVHVHLLPTSRYFAAQAVVPFYVWNLLVGRYDFVWIYFAGYGEAEAMALVRRQRFGIVFHFPYAQVPHRYREFSHYGLIQKADTLVSVSQFVAKGVHEAFGRDSMVIHHGVDATRFAPDLNAHAAMRKKFGIEEDALLLVTAAALEERKGIQFALRALPLVLDRFPRVTYWVLGEGAYRSALEQETHALGMEQHVHFLGAQADIVPYYQAADVALILARGEASSLAALEALACGVPVIAADQPPFDELVHPQDSICVDETVPLQVANVILKFANDSALRRRMGDHGRARMIRDFTWERAAKAFLALMKANQDDAQ